MLVIHPNVTLEILNEHLPCFLCGEKLDIRKDKRGKPYMICDHCGTQTFIRRKSGINHLNQLILEINRDLKETIKIRAIMDQIDYLNKKTELIKSERKLIDKITDENPPEINLMEKEIQKLIKKIEEIQNPNKSILNKIGEQS